VAISAGPQRARLVGAAIHSPTAATAAILALAVLAIVVLIRTAQGRDSGQWADVGERINYWFAHLMRPDAPGSCCGEADAYWADEVKIGDGQVWAVVTDDRPDEPLGRPHVPRGAMVYVPPEKMKSDKGNPTGHIVIFLGSGWDGANFHNFETICYVANTGT
jgi:hypothetical protein